MSSSSRESAQRQRRAQFHRMLKLGVALGKSDPVFHALYPDSFTVAEVMAYVGEKPITVPAGGTRRAKAYASR